MVVGTNVYNAGQFVYHSVALRSLGESYYGDLAAIISVFGLVGTMHAALSLTIVKFVAGHKEEKSLKNFVTWVNWWGILLGLCLGGIFLLLSPILAHFLRLHDKKIIYLLGPIISFFIVGGSGRAILQGLLRFNEYVLGILIEMGIKILLTTILVYLSYAVWGATIALLIGTVVGYAITRFCIRDMLLAKRKDRPELKPLLRFSLPVLVQGMALTSMYSADLLLVKHFFPAYPAGIYASLAVLGRVAFFVSSPVGLVMFPFIIKKHIESKPYQNIFFLSLLLTVALSSTSVLFFRFFPHVVLSIFSGHIVPEAVPLLWWFSLFMAFLSIGALFTQFYLSVGKTWVVWLFTLSALLQISLIWLFHSSLLQVIHMSILCSSLLSAALLLYFPYHKR